MVRPGDHKSGAARLVRFPGAGSLCRSQVLVPGCDLAPKPFSVTTILRSPPGKRGNTDELWNDYRFSALNTSEPE